jgi:hypothetical protein
VYKKQVVAAKKKYPHWRYIGWKEFSFAGYFPVMLFKTGDGRVVYVRADDMEVVEGSAL